MSKRPITTYIWPETLYPLRDWLRRKGVDVDDLKSERQAFWMARTLGRQKTKFTNDRSKPLFPYMLKLQRSLCPNEQGGKAPVRRDPFIPGTFGAASEARHIDPAEYLAGKARAETRKEGAMPISADKMKLYPGGSIKSPEWQAIRDRIRIRAGNRCEKCGVENHALGGRLHSGKFLKAQPKGDNGLRLVWPKPGEEWWCGEGEGEPIKLRIIKIVCTVAHFDNHLTDHSDDNLRFWCQQCHLRHDARQHAASARLTRRRKAPQIDLEDWLSGA